MNYLENKMLKKLMTKLFSLKPRVTTPSTEQKDQPTSSQTTPEALSVTETKSEVTPAPGKKQPARSQAVPGQQPTKKASPRSKSTPRPKSPTSKKTTTKKK